MSIVTITTTATIKGTGTITTRQFPNSIAELLGWSRRLRRL